MAPSLEMLNWKREMRRQRVPLSSLAQGGHVAAQVFVRLLRQMSEPVTRTSFGRHIAGSPRLPHPFLGMPLELGPGASRAPNRASIAMTIRQGGWRIASAAWIVAPADILQP